MSGNDQSQLRLQDPGSDTFTDTQNLYIFPTKDKKPSAQPKLTADVLASHGIHTFLSLDVASLDVTLLNALRLEKKCQKRCYLFIYLF